MRFSASWSFPSDEIFMLFMACLTFVSYRRRRRRRKAGDDKMSSSKRRKLIHATVESNVETKRSLAYLVLEPGAGASVLYAPGPV